MPVKSLKPTSPGVRGMSRLQTADITKTKPEKSLLKPIKKHSGRNNTGRITVRHQGGGSRQHYRMIDFKRNKLNIPAVVKAVEYDPNRNVRIALLVMLMEKNAIYYCLKVFRLATVLNLELLLRLSPVMPYHSLIFH